MIMGTVGESGGAEMEGGRPECHLECGTWNGCCLGGTGWMAGRWQDTVTAAQSPCTALSRFPPTLNAVLRSEPFCILLCQDNGPRGPLEDEFRSVARSNHVLQRNQYSSQSQHGRSTSARTISTSISVSMVIRPPLLRISPVLRHP